MIITITDDILAYSTLLGNILAERGTMVNLLVSTPQKHRFLSNEKTENTTSWLLGSVDSCIVLYYSCNNCIIQSVSIVAWYRDCSRDNWHNQTTVSPHRLSTAAIVPPLLNLDNFGCRNFLSWPTFLWAIHCCQVKYVETSSSTWIIFFCLGQIQYFRYFVGDCSQFI